MGTGAADLAAALKCARESADLTQQEMAERAGVPLTTLRNIEQGRVTEPRALTVRAILGAIRSLEHTSPATSLPSDAVTGPTSGE